MDTLLAVEIDYMTELNSVLRQVAEPDEERAKQAISITLLAGALILTLREQGITDFHTWTPRQLASFLFEERSEDDASEA